MDKEKKMTLEEYQRKYNKNRNTKVYKTFLFLFAVAIGFIIAVSLFLITTKVYDMNKYAGYGMIGISVLLFILLYIVPLVKLAKTKSFMTLVSNEEDLTKAKKFNKKLREDLADKMIDLKDKTEELSYYSDDSIGKLAVARHTNNDKSLREALTNIYKNDIKKACNKIIRDHALKVGLTTALSQSDALDTLFVSTYDLSLIKDIIFLYGFRPNETELAKIYRNVILASITAYGLSNATSNTTSAVVSKLGHAATGIPFIGKAIETVVDSSIQGFVNATFTVIVGFQTKNYLMKEYKLQDILEDVIYEEEEELKEEEELVYTLKDDIKANTKDKKANVVNA